jgi:uncharacterized protein (TIGR02118 family)
MHKLIALYEKPADEAQFRSHLEKIHLPLVAKFPGLRAMRHGFDIINPETSNYFAVVECEFDSAEEMHVALASPESQAAAADVPNYASAGVTILTYAIADELECERQLGRTTR